MQAGQHADAAALSRELLPDPLARASRDRDIAEAREAHARALIGCCQAPGDLAGLDRALEGPGRALERHDVAAGVRARTTPAAATGQ